MTKKDFRDRLRAKKEALPEGGERLVEGGSDPKKETIPKKKQLDEKEIMATAFQALSTGEVELEWDELQIVQTGERPPPDASPPPPPPAPALPSPQGLHAEPPHKKAPTPALDPSQWQGRGWDKQDLLSASAEHLAAHNPFAKVEHHRLSTLQQALLERVAKLPPSQLLELNLRHQNRKTALDQLRRAVAQMRRLDQRYLRIITGKGIGSAGAPVLRQEVIHWCSLQANRHALQWTPEAENSREYGAILVDLQPPIAPT